MEKVDGKVNRKRICIIATIPFSLKMFMSPHIRALSAEHNVTLVANGSAEYLADLLGPHVSFKAMPIERKISLRKDLVSLVTLWQFFRREKFDCVHSITPKAGLLSMVAARFAGIPLRLHTFTGQVWATETGRRKWLLKLLDKILARSATQVLADSFSQRQFLIENGVVRPQDITVLAEGSIAGVDVNRFKFSDEARTRIRQAFGIPANETAFLFLGRLNRFKGIEDLLHAFAIAAKSNSNLHLIVAGPDEEKLAVAVDALASNTAGKVHRLEYVDFPEHYMSAADVFCLPSYREGFGAVLIEAAAVGIPVIASRIYGITDAVDEGKTGLLHTPGAVTEIADAMLLLASNNDLRTRMGAAGRARVIETFSETYVTQAFIEFYRAMLSNVRVIN
jgi:glycosyltransferase involved in cell wall biosynthesis